MEQSLPVPLDQCQPTALLARNAAVHSTGRDDHRLTTDSPEVLRNADDSATLFTDQLVAQSESQAMPHRWAMSL
ncbi:hypothetical protein IWX81_000302 [Salinibacterium sp. CAN_S4]|uniref:hypothetical protein n=1 Tax=Salinibacterium sp. CAN_S4 TaxID=2787727 RepID=UPI0018EF7948